MSTLARCENCGEPTGGGWVKCPEDGVRRDMIFEEASGFYVDAVVPPRYVVSAEDADGNIICDPCDTSSAVFLAEGSDDTPVYEPEDLIR